MSSRVKTYLTCVSGVKVSLTRPGAQPLAITVPVDDVTGLIQAIRILLGCPFRNGLRARRPLA
jgi:hypothetical protein